MSRYTVTLIKTGNSYALRVPKQYVDDNNLREGQKVSIEKPVVERKQDNAKLIRILEGLQEATAAVAPRGLASIKDPVAWQREIRKDRPLPGRDY